MSIKRYTSNKDNTISSAFKLNLTSRGITSNMGSSDILEIFSIFGQASSASLEQSRVLMGFPIDKIMQDRTAGTLPVSGSVTFKLKMYNAEHNQTVPERITLSASPLTKDWNEGTGLDMEALLDVGPSNWTSASSTQAWATSGGDFISSDWISSAPVDLSYNQFLESGTEDVEIDITGIMEEFLVNQAGNSTPASGSIIFNETNKPAIDDAIKLYGYNGDYKTFKFASTTGSVGNTVLVLRETTAAASSTNLINAINNSTLSSSIAATGQGGDLTASLAQRAGTFYGNTIISSSAAANVAAITNFSGGKGALNYGFLLRLSGSQEDGSLSRSYYTKKFFARSSHHFLERPIVEAQWDSSIKDDRSRIFKSSSLMPAADNINNIYLYNRTKSGLVDIPATASNLVVQLVPSVGGTPVAITGASVSNNHITASKASNGIYKASFAYAGSEQELYDIWKIQQEITAAKVTVMTDTGTLGASTIVLTNSDNTSVTLTSAALGAGNPSTATQINTDLIGNANDAATQLKASLDAAVTAGTLKMTVSAITNNSSSNPRVITLTQTVKGTSGNKAISGTLISSNKLIINNISSSSQGVLSFQDGIDLSYTEVVTGSSITINTEAADNYYNIPSYTTNITNLKSAYCSTESPTFRIYTRNKNWQPNIYTVASNRAAVNIIPDAYYRLKRVADDFTIINYSTGSTPSYSQLSYDTSGSYFDLDISILEPNYLYEISFLHKDGTSCVEQKEKFKFRVDP
tara:strand:- start:1279 stop:3525 length:2247 start_codon:yes stop_codon:yes gene_type:complete